MELKLNVSEKRLTKLLDDPEEYIRSFFPDIRDAFKKNKIKSKLETG